MNLVKIGIAGPVGSGKTSLVEALSTRLKDKYSIGVITNDIYTKADSSRLVRKNILDESRVLGVESGGCPHLAIREDTSMNEAAIKQLQKQNPDLELVFIESGGDNLSATFSPDLVDRVIYVISVGEGDDIPKKGGPGILKSDMLLVNKIDLAPYVYVDLEKLESDVKEMRDGKRYLMTDVMAGTNVDKIIEWIENDVLLEGGDNE